MAQRQIINGNFQDALGNPLNLGYLTVRLSTDATTNTNQVCAGTIITVPLDAFGNIIDTVSLWPNDQLTPTNTVYIFRAYTARGQFVWRGEFAIPSGGGAYNLGGPASPSFILMEDGSFILLEDGSFIQMET